MTAPVVSGVENGKNYANPVSPTFYEGMGKLDGADYTSGTEITTEGNHELVVTDLAGNVTTVNFYIDMTVPEVSRIENGKIYASPVSPRFNEGTAKLDGVDYISGKGINTEGSHELVVTDAAGNMTKVQFSIYLNCEESKGTVRYLEFEGGFYGIVGNDGKHYRLIYKPNVNLKDGDYVSFKWIPSDKEIGTQMWGKAIQIIYIEAIR